MDGVTAAAIGAITGAVVVLARRQLLTDGGWPDWIKVALCVATIALLWRFKKLPEPLIVLAAACLGLVLYPLAR